MPSSNTSTTARTGGFLSLTQPSESADGYFPRGATASNTTKTSPTRSESPLDDLSSASNSSIGSSNHPLSPLDRNYTKPLGGDELNIAEQLEKEPTYWSARGWVQRSVTATTNGTMIANARDDAAARARKFEETKKDLLASAGRF